ncbi:MAG: hypothetical protein LBV15_00595, partial [Planctomycetota bacterium]|nr:hypothetical protein [Planctomycetota bacterium]
MLRYLALAGDWFGPLRVFESLTVRASVGVIVAFLAAVFLGPVFIARMAGWRATEDVEKPDARRLEELHRPKRGTPTMGGAFLVAAVSLAALLCCDPLSPLVWIGQFVLLSFAALGFVDDYWKLRGWGKQGLRKRHKFAGEILLAALAVSLLVWGGTNGWFGMSAPP